MRLILRSVVFFYSIVNDLQKIKLCDCSLLYESANLRGLRKMFLSSNISPPNSEDFGESPHLEYPQRKYGYMRRRATHSKFSTTSETYAQVKLLFFQHSTTHRDRFGHNSIINAKLGLTFGDLYYIILCIFIAKHLYKPRTY